MEPRVRRPCGSMKELFMDFINPDTLKLTPGQSMEGLFVPAPGGRSEVGFFIRTSGGDLPLPETVRIRQRAGVVQFNDVMLVVTMIKLEGQADEYFDVWWNFCSNDGSRRFKLISEQESLTFHFYTEEGKSLSVNAPNEFKKFFKGVPHVIDDGAEWTDIEFDRAVRGFCAQAYPKEKLWEMIDGRTLEPKESEFREKGIDDYDGRIPDELRPYYVYLPEKGHCIRVIPSAWEQDALINDPEALLLTAPVRTVLRCGLRWVKGYPVAPIPFIPGVGLAAPPDDTEF
jgi:hypothetical protein